MKILFLGTLYSIEQENLLLEKSKTGLQNQANSFQWNLINGFDSTLEIPLDIINVLPVGSYPKNYSDLILKSRIWSHVTNSFNKEIGSINLPFLKQIERSIKIKYELNQWVRNHKNEHKLHVVVYSTYLPFLMSIRSLPKKVKVTLIVTDLPEYDDLSSTKNTVKKLLRLIHNTMIYKLLNGVDFFVLLTEFMNIAIKVNDRPYVIVEGISPIINVADKITLSQNKSNNKCIVLYTGTLHYQFGIKTLLEAFEIIESLEYELWICGAGEAEKEILDYCKMDDRIKFYGYVTKQEINNLQLDATIVINPRTNEGEYTKYSFPSKTMEYMSSGKPLLMHKLDGVPSEYDEFIHYFSGQSPKDIASKIIEIGSQNEAERDLFGQNARRFIINNKNSTTQAAKILDMIEKFDK